MNDQTRKAYWQSLSAILTLEEKVSWLREDEIKAEEAIYSIRPENDSEGTWEAWASYIEDRMAASRKLEKIKFTLQKCRDA